MREFKVFLIGFILLFGGWCAYYSYLYERGLQEDPELAGKKPYMFLQDSESVNQREAPDVKIAYSKNEKFCATGLKQGKNKIWLLLNYSDDLNGVYILGNETYSLTQQDYNEMEKFCKIDPRVSVELKKHLR